MARSVPKTDVTEDELDRMSESDAKHIGDDVWGKWLVRNSDREYLERVAVQQARLNHWRGKK